MPNLVISLAYTGRLAKAFAGRRHRGKLCTVNLWMALAAPNDVCRWQILLQKSAITVREDCLDLLTRLPTMPLFGER